MTLSPQTYHFSNPTPPTLTFILTSHAPHPLTILVSRSSPLDTTRSMNTGAYPIFDLSTSPPTPVPIGDMTGYLSSPPVANELVVLRPGQASRKFEVAFNRGASYEAEFRPEPWSVVRRGRVRDGDGRETAVRRPSVVHGVDGLEAGKGYRTTVAVEKLDKMPWWWGEEKDRPNTARSGGDGGGIEWDVENGGVEFRVEE